MVCLAAALAVVTGCSKLPDGNAHVTGQFYLENGDKLTGLAGVVRFDPEELYTGGDRGASIGELNRDGSFRLMTRSKGDGVPVGEYRVALVVRGADGSPADQVHFDYKHFETTPWRVVVEPDTANHFELTLEDADKRPLLEHDLPDHDY